MQHQTVLIVRAKDPAADYLQQEVTRHALPIPDSPNMFTAFLVLRRYQSAADPNNVASQMLMSIDPNYIKHLNPKAFEEPWEGLELTSSRMRLRQWLTEGLAVEPPIFDGDTAGADAFLDELYAWIGNPVTAFTNRLPLFIVPQCVDHGIVLVGPNHIGLLWFLGYD